MFCFTFGGTTSPNVGKYQADLILIKGKQYGLADFDSGGHV